MSIKYYCDKCKGHIVKKEQRVTLSVLESVNDKKTVYHLCSDCWGDVRQYLIEEPTLPTECTSTQSAQSTQTGSKTFSELLQEQMIKDSDATPTNSAGRVKTVDIDRHKFQEWELTCCPTNSKYFTNEVCSALHRFMLIGAKSNAMARYFNIPYQNINLYMRTTYRPVVMETYQPKIDKSILEAYAFNYKSAIPKVKALMATCTWSFKDIAEECHIPESVVSIIWNELPYFVNNVKEEEKPITIED